MPELKYVYADSANLTTFNSKGFNLPNIITLTLSNNPLWRVDIREGLIQVKTLVLRNTSLRRFDETIAYLPNLNILHISGDFLRYINVSHFPKLRTLFVVGSQNLKKIHFDVQKSKSFERLFIDRESLECDCEWLKILIRRPFDYFDTKMCKGWQRYETVFSFYVNLGCSLDSKGKSIELSITVRHVPTTVSYMSTAAFYTPTTYFPWGIAGKFHLLK